MPSGNVLLRREQFRFADQPEKSLLIGRTCVAAKIGNCRTVLQRAIRDHDDTADTSQLSRAIRSLARSIENVEGCGSLDSLRGIEGEAARCYFGVFNSLIRSVESSFEFRGRNRRPPLDPANALLSFIYTLLFHDVLGALASVGLDPQVGFLHRDRPGRGGLALDLMEEFRPWFADRLVLSLINRGQIKPQGFTKRETGGVYMDDDTRKTVLKAYQERKQEELTHPFLKEKATVGSLSFLQALLLARHIRGDLDAYPAFVWR